MAVGQNTLVDHPKKNRIGARSTYLGLELQVLTHCHMPVQNVHVIGLFRLDEKMEPLDDHPPTNRH